MIRGVVKLLVVIIVVVAIAAFWFGRNSSSWQPDAPVSANSPVDTNKARDVGAKVGESVANAANETKEAVEEAALTTKIKSKMALDDLVKASKINVDTNGSVVTLTGVVGTETERQRAVQLAKETEGITSVVDHLQTR